MATSFFGGAFFGGEFFNTPGPTPEPTTTPSPAGRASKSRKRRVLIGSRMYDVDSLRDVEFLLKRVVREEVREVTKAAKARVRVVDRIKVDPEEEAPQRVPMSSVEVDWSALWTQLAMQGREYAQALERAIQKQEEDDLDALLLLI